MDATRTILAASGNQHKVRELQAILAPLGVRVLTPDDVGGIPEVEETAETFAENAVHKAVTVAAAVGMQVCADDSGLEVFALGGEPGVYSARYAGPDATDAERMAKLQARLAPHADRSARFVCVIAVAAPAALVGTARGEIRGEIALAARGQSGFGYDPIFVPEGHASTFAELSAAEKDQISHRGRALRIAVESGLFDAP